MKKLLLSLLTVLVAGAAQASLPFVTTPSATTLPIHWYQLKIEDSEKYVTYDPNGGIYNQVKISATASTNDNYLWCFVKISSDKILLYNRGARIVLGMPKGFYLSEYVGDGVDILYSTGKGLASKFKVVEIEVEGNDFETGDVNGDGVVSGADVTALYNVLLDNVTPAGNADVNGDGVVSGADVTALYNILLN